MKFQIIGSNREISETKSGHRFIKLCVVSTLNDTKWVGLHGEEIVLWDDTLNNLSFDTERGEFYAKNEKKYFIDIDFDRHGHIVSGRVYNG